MVFQESLLDQIEVLDIQILSLYILLLFVMNILVDILIL